MFKKYKFSCPKTQDLVKKTAVTMVSVLLSAGVIQGIDLLGGYVQKMIF